jgi:hypothetical protein
VKEVNRKELMLAAVAILAILASSIIVVSAWYFVKLEPEL